MLTRYPPVCPAWIIRHRQSESSAPALSRHLNENDNRRREPLMTLLSVTGAELAFGITPLLDQAALSVSASAPLWRWHSHTNRLCCCWTSRPIIWTSTASSTSRGC